MGVQRRVEDIKDVIEDVRTAGVASARGIAMALNDRGIMTANDAAWHAASVARLLRTLGARSAPTIAAAEGTAGTWLFACWSTTISTTWTAASAGSTAHTADEALAVCRRLVDLSLEEGFKPGISADELYRYYRSFGDDPFVVAEGDVGEAIKFSAWTYAKARCEEICR
jgi:hypothetical protein